MRTPEEILKSLGISHMLDRVQALDAICLAVQEAVEKCLELGVGGATEVRIRAFFKEAGY